MPKTIVTESVKLAAEFLQQGELVAFPTETVYGLGALINQQAALHKIYEVKGRPKDNPLILHIHSNEQIFQMADCVSDSACKLVETFWPGPLTLIFPKKANAKYSYSLEAVNADLPTIALRRPSHTVAQQLLKLVNVPIAAPSANLSGKPSATTFQHVLQDFEDKIACVLKSQHICLGLESTVIDCSVEPFRLLRLGSLEIEEIQRIIPLLDLNALNESCQKPLSPGLKYKHYAPEATVILISREDTFKILTDTKNAYIGLNQPSCKALDKMLICTSLADYAENLFAFFRDCDDENINNIYCELPPDQGLGKSIKDRLQKAAKG